MSDTEIDAIVAELAGIAERLDEVAFEALRSAVAEGATSRPDLERRVVRARNAIERARRILGDSGSQDGADEQP